MYDYIIRYARKKRLRMVWVLLVFVFLFFIILALWSLRETTSKGTSSLLWKREALKTRRRFKIAILIPVCSRNRVYTLSDYPFKTKLLSSLAFSNKYYYKLFVGSDHDDPFFTLPDVGKDMKRITPHEVQLMFFNDTAQNPVRVWNYLFQQAYQEGYDYFYQIGDDIVSLGSFFSKPDFSTVFVQKLQAMNNIGVTGPYDQNNPKVLTQSFVHRTHMDIFGFYYPPELKNWFCDDWIQHVYSKYNLCIHTKEVKVTNSKEKPRYKVENNPELFKKLATRDSLILKKALTDNFGNTVLPTKKVEL